MGFVRIHGKAKSDQLITSPVTHTLCCYYAVEIVKWEISTDSQTTSMGRRRDEGTWLHHGAEADGGWFYLEDSTGRVLVNPHGAQYQLEMTGMREVGGARLPASRPAALPRLSCLPMWPAWVSAP